MDPISLKEAIELARLVREGKSRSYVYAAMDLGAFVEVHAGVFSEINVRLEVEYLRGNDNAKRLDAMYVKVTEDTAVRLTNERDAAVARTEKAELALSACEAQRRPIGRAISAWGVWCYGEGWCPAFATPERYGTQQEAVTAMARWVNENPGSKYSTRMMVIGDTGPTCDRGPKACDAEIDRLRTMLRKVAAPRCSDRDGFAWHCAECLKPVAGPKADCKDSDCSLATALRGY
jgi:hypothetical protein